MMETRATLLLADAEPVRVGIVMLLSVSNRSSDIVTTAAFETQRLRPRGSDTPCSCRAYVGLDAPRGCARRTLGSIPVCRCGFYHP